MTPFTKTREKIVYPPTSLSVKEKMEEIHFITQVYPKVKAYILSPTAPPNSHHTKQPLPRPQTPCY